MNIGVVGIGVVGSHMHDDIVASGNEPVVFDTCQPEMWWARTRKKVNECEAAFICVPTPMAENGECDIGAILDVFSWLDPGVLAIIRSTIPPGTTYMLEHMPLIDGKPTVPPGHEDCRNRDIVFCPEFIGEGVNAPYNAMRQPPFVIIGGEETARWRAIQIFQRLYNSECEFISMESAEAETCKYLENYFLALKVTWANECYDICADLGVDFHVVMNALTHDYRIGRSHTHVYEHARGWGGRCLPKDTSALLQHVGHDVAPLLAYTIMLNEDHRKQSIEP